MKTGKRKRFQLISSHKSAVTTIKNKYIYIYIYIYMMMYEKGIGFWRCCQLKLNMYFINDQSN